MRSPALWPISPLSQVMSPTSSTISNTQRTTEIFLQEQSSDTRPSYLHDAEISDDTIGRALSSPLFTKEREEPADRRQAYHSFDESLLPSQSLSVCHVRTVRQVHELSSPSSEQTQVATQKMSKSGFSLNDKKSKFSLIVEQRFRNTSSKPIMIEEVSRGIFGSQRSEINHARARDDSNKIRIFVELQID